MQQMLWIILGIIVICFIIWGFRNLSKERKDPEYFEKMRQKREEQIREFLD